MSEFGWRGDSIFFFNDTATTEIYTLSLHDALPISTGLTACRTRSRTSRIRFARWSSRTTGRSTTGSTKGSPSAACRSEEHTSELQSRQYLVCRLLLEKKKERELPPETGSALRKASI